MREIELIADLLAKPAPSPETVAEGRRRLREAERRRRFRKRLFSGGLGGLAVSAGGVAAGVLISGVLRGPSEEDERTLQPASPREDARSVLLALAAKAESQPLASGRYWHLKGDLWMGSGDQTPQNLGGEYWLTRAGQQWNRTVHARKLMKSSGKKAFDLCGTRVSYQRFLELPTTPDTLRSHMEKVLFDRPTASSIHPDKRGVFLTSCLIKLVASVPAPPKTRAAAFRVLAELPDLEELGVQEDRLGRSGTAIRFRDAADENQMIVDLDTTTVLETRRVLHEPPNKLVETHTIYEARWTDTPPS